MTTPERGRSWKTLLREQGSRLTPQREAVLQAVEQLGHATADDVQRALAVQAPTLNVSTIYRSLALLEELGAIQRVDLADRTAVYHSRTLPAHVHLACSRCGQVTDAEPEDFAALARALAGAYGFDTDLDRLVVPGTCRGCCPR